MPGAYDFLTGDAVPANSFKVTVDNEAVYVKEVSGLKKELDMVEIKTQSKEGQYFLRKLPGRQKPVTVTITRPLTDNDLFTKWIKAIETGAPDRRDVVVEVFGPGETAPKRTYKVVNCQPSSLEVTQVQAGATNPLDEKITLQGEQMEIE
jgi:phage tail-like protein